MILTQEFLTENRIEIIDIATEMMALNNFTYVTLKEVLVHFKETGDSEYTISENMEWTIDKMLKIENERFINAKDIIQNQSRKKQGINI